MTALGGARSQRQEILLDDITTRNGRWCDAEIDKLDKWAEDRRASIRAELEDLDDRLREARKVARLAPTLPEKLERQRAVRTLEGKREETWRTYDQASRHIDGQKEALLDDISGRLQQHIDESRLFVIRWCLV